MDELTVIRPEEEDRQLTLLIRNTIQPVMAQMAEMLKLNTEAIQDIAMQNKIMADRGSALETQRRLKQAKYINADIQSRAREILSKKELQDDAAAVKEMVKEIRRAVLKRYGIASISKIPEYDYQTVLNQIAGWNDMLVLRDISSRARKRAQENG